MTELENRVRELDILERIAIALEQLTLEYMEAKHSAPQAAVEQPPQRPAAPAPQSPEPPLLGVYATPPPAGPPVAPYQNPTYQVGSIHMSGHKPLKQNSKGLFCPTKLQDGSWCAWRVTP